MICTQAVPAKCETTDPKVRSGSEVSPVVTGFIDQISDVIFGLIKSRRLSTEEGCEWLAFDAAIRGLHGAIVALEDVGTSDEETRNRSW